MSLTWQQLPQMINSAIQQLTTSASPFFVIALVGLVAFVLYSVLPGHLALLIGALLVIILGLYTNIVPGWLFYGALLLILVYSFFNLFSVIFKSK